MHWIANIFYVVMGAAGLFFVHKLLWLMRARRIQRVLVAQALERLAENADTTVVRWDQGAEASWSEVSPGAGASPTDYVRKTEARLVDLETNLEISHTQAAPAFVRHVMEEHDPERVTLLRIPLVKGEHLPVSLDLDFPAVPAPDIPDIESLSLEVRSRYGLIRRMLAFVLGAADLVYSSQHIARMSQDPKMPWGVLLRRLSLVALVLVALGIDLGFQVRPRLNTWAESWAPEHLPGLYDTFGELLTGTMAMGIWLAGYGALYIGLFIYLRLRSQRHLIAFRELRERYAERVDSIRDEHLGKLHDWAEDYAANLDEAVQLTRLQAEMLIDRTRHRLRRRVASPELLELAEEVSKGFFEQLPEAATGLRDQATEHEHSWRHQIWPRKKEMIYQVEIAKYRKAWGDIEGNLAALRGQFPDPLVADQLWRNLVRYARMFPEIIDEAMFTRLQEAHGHTVSSLVAETDRDLAELDAQLSELASALGHTMTASGALVESRIDLAARSMQSAIADLGAEALRLREKARLEAMAFEI